MKDEITDYIEENSFETTYIGDTRSYQSKALLLPLKGLSIRTCYFKIKAQEYLFTSKSMREEV